MNIKSKFLRILFFLIFPLVSFVLLLPVFLQYGLPFKYDWSWPFFDMRQFWNGLLGDSSFGLFSAFSKNDSALFGLFGLIHLPPSILFKVFIFLVHFIAGYGFYKFIRSRVKSEVVAIVSGLAYAFSPYIFIRTIVGFVWSIVAYAVLPIFLMKFWQAKKKILDYLIIGFLFSLIFGQTQAGLLTLFIITIYTVYTVIGLLGRLLCRKYTLTPSNSPLPPHLASPQAGEENSRKTRAWGEPLKLTVWDDNRGQ